jgi:hypothetical protein
MVETTLAAASISSQVRLPYLMLGMLPGEAAAAVYAALLRVLEYGRIAPVMLINATNPSVNRERESDSRRYVVTMRRHLTAFAMIGFACALVLRGIGGPAISALFVLNRGETASTLAVLSLVMPLDLLNWFAGWHLLNQRRATRVVQAQAAGIAVQVALGLALVGGGGAEFAYALVAAFVVSTVIGLVLLGSTLKVPHLAREACLLMAPIVLVALLPAPASLSVIGIALAAVGGLLSIGTIPLILKPIGVDNSPTESKGPPFERLLRDGIKADV